MKKLAENVPDLLFVKPAPAIPQENETLDKVLRIWIPQLLEHPEQVAQIRQYVFQDCPGYAAATNKKIKETELEQDLTELLPFFDKEKVPDLMLMLNGMKSMMEHFDLGSETELNAMMKARKAAFLISVHSGCADPGADPKIRQGAAGFRPRDKNIHR